MTDHLFQKSERIEVRALLLGQRLNMRALEQANRVATSPFVMRAGNNGYAVMFRYGVVVLFGLNAVEEATFVSGLEEFIIDPVAEIVREDCEVMFDKKGTEGAEPDHIRLKDLDVEKMQMVGEIFAKSVVLSYYEEQMSVTFDRIEPIAADLQKGKVRGSRTRDLLRHIGTTLSIQRKMVGQVQIDDKPDVLWERPDLERLYAKLEDEYELSERHNTLKEKLELVHKTAETLMGLLQEKRTLHVEWYITILIIIDIAIHIIETYILKI